MKGQPASRTTPALAALFALAMNPAWADPYAVFVHDLRGEPMAGVAVVIEGLPRSNDAPVTVVMDQRNERFVPEFLVVPSGGAVRFPNNDVVMHHVYSFSDAKSFDLPLFREEDPEPIQLDREGLVVVGCNIHDQMIGHILVAGSDYVALTDAEGRAEFVDLPAGPAEVVVWSPGLGAYGELRKAREGRDLTVQIAASKRQSRTIWDEDEY